MAEGAARVTRGGGRLVGDSELLDLLIAREVERRIERDKDFERLRNLLAEEGGLEKVMKQIERLQLTPEVRQRGQGVCLALSALLHGLEECQRREVLKLLEERGRLSRETLVALS